MFGVGYQHSEAFQYEGHINDLDIKNKWIDEQIHIYIKKNCTWSTFKNT